jgi:anti-sigma B factor antagonist
MARRMPLPETGGHLPSLVGRAVASAPMTVVYIRGEYDLSTVAALGEVLAPALAGSDAHVVIDLSGVEFMDSAAMHVFADAAALLADQSRTLVLRSPSPFGRRLLDVFGLGGLVEQAPANAGHLTQLAREDKLPDPDDPDSPSSTDETGPTPAVSLRA